jgi:hypothetical protein
MPLIEISLLLYMEIIIRSGTFTVGAGNSRPLLRDPAGPCLDDATAALGHHVIRIISQDRGEYFRFEPLFGAFSCEACDYAATMCRGGRHQIRRFLHKLHNRLLRPLMAKDR